MTGQARKTELTDDPAQQFVNHAVSACRKWPLRRSCQLRQLCVSVVVGLAALSAGMTAGKAAECRPDALGTHRTLKVSAADGPVGLINYRRTLDLADKELVLTFDDGPVSRRTPAVLKALADECVKATFFVVGSMVASHPDVLQQTADAGHTIGTHTWSHAYLTRKRARTSRDAQIAGGFQAANIVLGEERRDALSPLFRFPGLGRNKSLDRFVADNGLISMSVDIDSTDWHKITPQEVLKRTLSRIEARGKGIVLMHDIHARTVTMLPDLLRELKERGYKIVHVAADRRETEVALASLAEPKTRTFQVVMARTKQKLAVMTAQANAAAFTGPEKVVAAPAATGPAPLRADPVQVAARGFEAVGLRR